MPRAFAELAFTPSVRAMQARLGSAANYEKFLAPEVERGDRLGDDEIGFIGERDGFYQASVSETGWPYVQYRGGPAGFLKVLDARTLAYADFRGNRQYLSTGNLTANDRIALILVDYAGRRRLKLWGRARLIDVNEDAALVDELHDPSYRARPERAVVISLEAFDWNCPAHISRRLTEAEMAPYLAQMREEIERLTAENHTLKQGLSLEA